MNILEIIGELNGGGVGSVVYNYLSHMQLSDFNIDLLIFDSDSKDESKEIEKFVALGCNIIIISHRNRGYKKHFADFKTIIDKNKYDIIHCHMGIWSAPYLLISKIKGVPVRIAHSHIANEEYAGVKKILLKLFKPILRFSVTDKFACGIDAGKFLWGSLDGVYIMNNAVDVESFEFSKGKRDMIRNQLSIADDVYLIGHVGRFCYQKNQEFIIDIAQNIDKYHKKCIFVLIGTGENLASVQRIIHEKKLEEKFLLLGYRNDVSAQMNAMDCFVLPSRYEGLPVVAIEAQANGLPILLSNKISSETKILEESKFLSINGNASEWCSYISKLSTPTWDRRIVAKAAIKKAGFDINLESQKLYCFYKGKNKRVC